MFAPGFFHVTVCVSESPWIGGGSVNVVHSVNGVIDRINTQAQSHCDNAQGQGTNTFSAHCGCGGSCQLTGSWEIVYKR